jgi:hypothetical protein
MAYSDTVVIFERMDTIIRKLAEASERAVKDGFRVEYHDPIGRIFINIGVKQQVAIL